MALYSKDMGETRSDEVRSLVLKAADRGAPEPDRHDAFGKLIMLFQDMAYACAFASLGDFHLAENAAQDAFIAAWQNLSQLREPAAFPGWLRRVVMTQCNRIRRRGSMLLLDQHDGNVPSGSEDPQTIAERSELQNTVNAAIQKLPPNERLAVTLFYLNGCSHNEISAVLGVPVTTVAKRLHTARGRLQGKLPVAVKEGYMARRPSSDRSFAKKVLAGIFDEYLGEYRYDERPDLVVVITRHRNKLIAEAGGQRNELFARPRSRNELRAKEFDGLGRFVRNAKGQITHFVYYEFGHEMGMARKVK